MFGYGFEEGKDYTPVLANRSDGLPVKRRRDYALSLDYAKHISMVQRTEKGMQASNYFIELEKDEEEIDLISQ